MGVVIRPVTAAGHAVERQAAALVKRELTLDQQQDAFKDREATWQGQRRHYEQQIRELTSRMRSLPQAA